MHYCTTDSDIWTNDNGTGSTLGPWSPTEEQELEVRKLLAVLYPGERLAWTYMHVMCPDPEGDFTRDSEPECAVVILARPVFKLNETAIPAGQVWTVQQLKDAAFLRLVGDSWQPGDDVRGNDKAVAP